MARVRLQMSHVTDWAAFHREFAQVLGFPSFYGENLDAWIDCMSSLRDPLSDEMVGIRIGSHELLELELDDYEDFSRRLPEVASALAETAAFVNRERYSDPAIALVSR